MKTILVTRPSPDGEALCELLDQAGFNTVFLPTLTLEPIQVPKMDCSTYHYTIFISPAAVRFFVAGNHVATWPSQTRVAVIGSATANACAEHGIPVALLPQQDYTSEGLLALPELASLPKQSILIVEGEGGRDTIARVLRTRGASVTEMRVYRRSPSIQNDLPVEWHAIDVIIATSLSTLQTLIQSQSPAHLADLLQTAVLVSSDRLQQGARELGFTGPILRSSNATALAIKNTLSALIKQ